MNQKNYDCPCVNQGFSCIEPWSKCEKCAGTGFVVKAQKLKIESATINGVEYSDSAFAWIPHLYDVSIITPGRGDDEDTDDF